jgi:hypothetical protein
MLKYLCSQSVHARLNLPQDSEESSLDSSSVLCRKITMFLRCRRGDLRLRANGGWRRRNSVALNRGGPGSTYGDCAPTVGARVVSRWPAGSDFPQPATFDRIRSRFTDASCVGRYDAGLSAMSTMRTSARARLSSRRLLRWQGWRRDRSSGRRKIMTCPSPRSGTDLPALR